MTKSETRPRGREEKVLRRGRRKDSKPGDESLLRPYAVTISVAKGLPGRANDCGCSAVCISSRSRLHQMLLELGSVDGEGGGEIVPMAARGEENWF